MATFTVDITQNNILTAVKRIASFEGRSEVTDDGPAYEAIRITDQDEALLLDFYEEAKLNVMKSFAGYISFSTPNLTLTESKGFITDLRDTIKSEIQNYIKCFIISRWFTMVLKSKKEEYENRAAEHLLNAENCFYKKATPTLPS